MCSVQVVSVPQTDLCPADDQGPQTETMGRVSLPASCGMCVLGAANLKGLSGQGSVGWPSEVSLSLYMQPNAPATAGPIQNRDEVTGGSGGMEGPEHASGHEGGVSVARVCLLMSSTETASCPSGNLNRHQTCLRDDLFRFHFDYEPIIICGGAYTLIFNSFLQFLIAYPHVCVCSF